LPPSLTSLAIGHRFSSSIHRQALPQSLTSLKLGHSFNSMISEGVLPSSLMTLTLGASFNQLIDVGVLPPSLTSLTFNQSRFNHPLRPGVLPGSLGQLTLAYSFNQTITRDMLPNSLTYLTVHAHTDQIIELPNSLTLIDLSSIHKVLDTNNGMHTVTYSELTRSQLPLPQSLTSLRIRDFGNSIPPGFIPESLLELSFDQAQPVYPGMLPPTLQTLTFGHDFDQRIEPGMLPASLTELRFGHKFKTSLEPGVLPPSITSLKFGYYFHALTQDILPASLISLDLRDYCAVSFPRITNLTLLSFESLKNIKCINGVGSLTIAKCLHGMTKVAVPVIGFNLETLRIHLDKSVNTPSELKRRELFIKMVMGIIPNVVTYHFINVDWSVHVRRPASDSRHALVIIRTMPFDKQTIQFITLDQSGPLPTRLVEENQRLRDECELQQHQIEELNKQVAHWKSECERLMVAQRAVPEADVPTSDNMDSAMNDDFTETPTSTTTSKGYTSFTNKRRR
ncbi:hypothetical protein SAMD00019534_108530, partial [Acytostelium subglobosum LB1]|uniref:hypothetical protein n=1 Tax=Acytostelium subglobosum LB1 TaxID=1410327 RepID=UPI000644EB26